MKMFKRASVRWNLADETHLNHIFLCFMSQLIIIGHAAVKIKLNTFD